VKIQLTRVYVEALRFYTEALGFTCGNLIQITPLKRW
jgi:hypothetical protein